MLYRYQWTEDGVIEHGTVEQRTAADDAECYHCGCRIKKNEIMTLFNSDDADTYMICKKCSSVSFEPDNSIMHEMMQSRQ